VFRVREKAGVGLDKKKRVTYPKEGNHMTTPMIPGGGASAPGSGSKIQLAAVGKQDAVLRGCFSHFIYGFKRSTRFAMWTDSFAIDYVPGKRVQVDIPKSGDALLDMSLEIRLPAIQGAPPGAQWTSPIGYAIFRRVRLLLNDQEIHNFERLWYDIRDSITQSSGHARGMDAMIGRRASLAKSHVVYVPLRFLTCGRGISRAPLPLQAIPRASLKLDIEWEDTAVLTAGYTPTDPGISVTVLADYVELEEPERTKLLKGGTMAFESAIDSDGLSYYIDSDGIVRDLPAVRVNLGNVRFAVKALVWVAYTETGPLFTYLAKPLTNAFISFNNQDRITPRPAEYFDIIQQYQHCKRSDPGAPAVYSFAMDATARMPSGVADFGALAEASLRGTVHPGNPRFKVKVFSMYYNFIEIGGASAKVVFV
jgi:hypothetical protein